MLNCKLLPAHAEVLISRAFNNSFPIDIRVQAVDILRLLELQGAQYREIKNEFAPSDVDGLDKLTISLLLNS